MLKKVALPITPTTQQRLHTINIEKLKSLKNVSVSFEDKNVTAILGPNGNGKTTILHALACCYQPEEDDCPNYKFSHFFLPHPDALWQGSKITVNHSWREGKEEHKNMPHKYEKKIDSDRWSPKYIKRPKRNIVYFGIDKCVPLIEIETREIGIKKYETKSKTDDISITVLKKASSILNKNYKNYNIHTVDGKEFIGVESDEGKYSALSMSAGEQKVFLILDHIFRAGKHSLILIDEIDLLLHDTALKNLIKVIVDHSQEKKLQVIFTTHRESIIELSDLINIRHLFNTTDKTLCFNETKPDAINRLIGKQPKTLEVYVEDKVSEAVAKKVASELGITRHLAIVKFGAAQNAFTTISGLLLSGESCENCVFVLDGDVFTTSKDRQDQINNILTGTDDNASRHRATALTKIIQYTLPPNTKPEKHLHSMLCGAAAGNDESSEIVKAAKEIVCVQDEHQYIGDLSHRLNIDVSKIIDVISTNPKWIDYTDELRKWLGAKKIELEEREQ